MSTNNNNNRSRSSSLPPLRQIPVRAPAPPSASSPIMEQAGEMNTNSQIEMVNGRISVLEDLIRTLSLSKVQPQSQQRAHRIQHSLSLLLRRLRRLLKRDTYRRRIIHKLLNPLRTLFKQIRLT